MEVKHLRTLGLEVFKNLNNLNPAFMEGIFYRTKWLTHRPNNIQVNVHKRTKFGDNGDNLIKFKEYINQWFRTNLQMQFVCLH